MKINIFAVGKTNLEYKTILENYIKRINAVCKINFTYLKEEKLPESQKKEIIKKEQKKFLEKINQKNSYIICLDKIGRQMDSEKFANFIKSKQENRNIDTLYFFIGGTFGFSKDFLDESNHVLSFSDMTFTHQIIRLILLEQIYRAFEIIKGSKYHK